jgi:uncharacterized membrane-anchored protein
MYELLLEAGFTDIQENANHTFNATKDGERYFNLHVSGIIPIDSKDTVVTIPVTLDY